MPRALLLLAFLAGAIAQALAPTAHAADEAGTDGEVRLPVSVGGTTLDMLVQVHKPPGNGPFPVVIHLHGRGVNRLERAGLGRAVSPEHARWWLRQGVAVVAPVRVGYGATGGPDVEDTGARWQGGQCTGDPDFTRVAWAARDAASVAHRWAVSQPWAAKDRILIEGYSLGGLASVATAALGLPGVRGVVNFSGGTAGNPIDAPGRSCRPELLAEAYRLLGRDARVPSLWLYAQNDRYWGADAPKAWHAAYRQGGGDGTLILTPPVAGADGHDLLRRGVALWTEPVSAFIRTIGFVPP